MMILMALGACFGLLGVVVLLYRFPIRISDTLIINPLFIVFKLGPIAAAPLAVAAAPLIWIGRLFGKAIQRRDMSCWILDVESKTLTKSVKVGSATLSSSTYDVSAADSVVVGPPVPGADIGLYLTRRGDTPIELANDRRWHEFGYQTDDLLRVGQRVAKALGTKCEEVTELPKAIRGY